MQSYSLNLEKKNEASKEDPIIIEIESPKMEPRKSFYSRRRRVAPPTISKDGTTTKSSILVGVSKQTDVSNQTAGSKRKIKSTSLNIFY